MARKLPKKPKTPRKSSSLVVWQRFDSRMKDWEKRCREIKAEPAKKEAIARKYRK